MLRVLNSWFACVRACVGVVGGGVESQELCRLHGKGGSVLDIKTWWVVNNTNGANAGGGGGRREEEDVESDVPTRGLLSVLTAKDISLFMTTV